MADDIVIFGILLLFYLLCQGSSLCVAERTYIEFLNILSNEIAYIK